MSLHGPEPPVLYRIAAAPVGSTVLYLNIRRRCQQITKKRNENVSKLKIPY